MGGGKPSQKRVRKVLRMIVVVIISAIVIGWVVGNYLLDRWINQIEMTSTEYKLYLFLHSETFYQYILPLTMCVIGLGIVYIKNGMKWITNEHLK